MRIAFGLISLLIVVLIVGKLAKTQLSTPVVPSALPASATAASATPREQVQAVGTQVQDLVNEAAAKRASEMQP